MLDDVTRADLLTAWRDATRAAELAERLADVAVEAADQADERELGSVDIAEAAGQAASAAQRAADSARAAADKASAMAAKLEGQAPPPVVEAVQTTAAGEADAGGVPDSARGPEPGTTLPPHHLARAGA